MYVDNEKSVHLGITFLAKCLVLVRSGWAVFGC